MTIMVEVTAVTNQFIKWKTIIGENYVILQKPKIILLAGIETNNKKNKIERRRLIILPLR